MADDGSNGAQDDGASSNTNQPGILGNTGFDPAWSLGGDTGQPSILGPALNPQPWTLANSTIHGLLSPEDIASIDFGDLGQPQNAQLNASTSVSGAAPAIPQQPDGGGFYTGLTPWQPAPAQPAVTAPASGGTATAPQWQPKDGFYTGLSGQPDTTGGYADPQSAGAASSPATGKANWVQLPQPGDLEAGEGGSGYYTYGTDKSGTPGTGPNAQWGTPKTMRVIGAVADKLATGDQYTPLGVGNISLEGGADFTGKNGHADHNDGLSIDVRPARTDGAQLPVSYRDPEYDRDATQRLVDAFRSTGQVSKIYFNDPQITGVQPWEGHDNHLHVKLTP